MGRVTAPQGPHGPHGPDRDSSTSASTSASRRMSSFVQRRRNGRFGPRRRYSMRLVSRYRAIRWAVRVRLNPVILNPVTSDQEPPHQILVRPRQPQVPRKTPGEPPHEGVRIGMLLHGPEVDRRAAGQALPVIETLPAMKSWTSSRARQPFDAELQDQPPMIPDTCSGSSLVGLTPPLHDSSSHGTRSGFLKPPTIDAMLAHLPCSCACHVSIQDVGKDGGGQTAGPCGRVLKRPDHLSPIGAPAVAPMGRDYLPPCANLRICRRGRSCFAWNGEGLRELRVSRCFT